MTLRLLFGILIFLSPLLSVSQSKTTEALQKRHSDANVFFFYHNTLRMLNQKEDKAFDDMIKDIEKMKLLMIKKRESEAEDFKKVVGDYKAENFEEMMTSRYKGKNFDILMKDGKDRGMVVLINDEANLLVLDIVGMLALDKVTQLYNMLDESADIGKQIRQFTAGDDEEEDDDDDGSEKNNP